MIYVCSDDGDIAVEEIVLDGAAVLGNREILDPSQLCSIQITGSFLLIDWHSAMKRYI